MKGNAIIFAVIMILVIAVVGIVNATQIINYQGHLTDSSGDPVADGDYQITFTIYDGGGVSHWSSGPLDIPVSNGMFSHNLGSVVPIPDDVFEIAELYLGIQVGTDPEISPKTLLTSAPKAAVAQNMWGGSVETGDGSMVLKNTSGDTAMVFTGDLDYHGIKVHPPEPCFPPDPCVPAIEISANNENRIDLYYPGADADAGIVQLIADPMEGGLIEIHAAEPVLGGRVLIGGSPTDTGFVRLLGGDHGAEYKLLEMTSHTNMGGEISLFDPENIDGRELLTMKSSPTLGTSIVGFNPQPEPPGLPAFEIGMNSAKDGPGSYVRLNNPQTGFTGEPLVAMTASPTEGGRLDVFYPRGGADAGIVQIGADQTVGGFIEIHAAEPLLGGRVMLGGSTTDTGFVRLLGGAHAVEYKLVELTSHTNNGGAMKFYDPTNTDGRELMTLKSSPTLGTSIVGFNPQPEPPGMPAFELGVNAAGKAGPGSYFRLNNPQTDYLDRPLVSMTTSPTDGGRLDIFYPGGDVEDGIVQIGANATDGGFIEIHAAEPLLSGRVIMGGSTTDTGFVRLLGGAHGAEYKLLEMTSHTNTGGRLSFFESDPADGRELLTMKSSPTVGTSIVGFNPQPEPPGHVAFEMVTSTAKGPGGGLSVYDTDSVSASLTGGVLQIGHDNVADYPSGLFEVSTSTCELTLAGEGAVGDRAVISMVARSDSAKVGIGTNAPAEALHVVGNIGLTGEVLVITDTKLKTNIRSIDNAVEIVRNMNGVRYNYKYNEYPEMKLSEKNQIGLLAQDVEKVLPELVHEDAEGIKYVAYTKLTAVLIEAVKELKTENEELKKRIEALEN